MKARFHSSAALNLGVRLSGQPAGNATVYVVCANTAVATVVPANLTFTPANWNTNQFVSVSGVQDADSFTGNTTLHVSASAVPSGPSTVSVTVVDDD